MKLGDFTQEERVGRHSLEGHCSDLVLSVMLGLACLPLSSLSTWCKNRNSGLTLETFIALRNLTPCLAVCICVSVCLSVCLYCMSLCVSMCVSL